MRWLQQELLLSLAAFAFSLSAAAPSKAPESLLSQNAAGGFDGDLDDNVYASADTGGSTWKAQLEAQKQRELDEVARAQAQQVLREKARRDAHIRAVAEQAALHRREKEQALNAPKAARGRMLMNGEIGNVDMLQQGLRGMMRREQEYPRQMTKALKEDIEQDDLDRSQWWGARPIMEKFDGAGEDKQRLLKTSDNGDGVYGGPSATSLNDPVASNDASQQDASGGSGVYGGSAEGQADAGQDGTNGDDANRDYANGVYGGASNQDSAEILHAYANNAGNQDGADNVGNLAAGVNADNSGGRTISDTNVNADNSNADGSDNINGAAGSNPGDTWSTGNTDDADAPQPMPDAGSDNMANFAGNQWPSSIGKLRINNVRNFVGTDERQAQGGKQIPVDPSWRWNTRGIGEEPAPDTDSSDSANDGSSNDGDNQGSNDGGNQDADSISSAPSDDSDPTERAVDEEAGHMSGLGPRNSGSGHMNVDYGNQPSQNPEGSDGHQFWHGGNRRNENPDGDGGEPKEVDASRSITSGAVFLDKDGNSFLEIHEDDKNRPKALKEQVRTKEGAKQVWKQLQKQLGKHKAKSATELGKHKLKHTKEVAKQLQKRKIDLQEKQLQKKLGKRTKEVVKQLAKQKAPPPEKKKPAQLAQSHSQPMTEAKGKRAETAAAKGYSAAGFEVSGGEADQHKATHTQETSSGSWQGRARAPYRPKIQFVQDSDGQKHFPG